MKTKVNALSLDQFFESIKTYAHKAVETLLLTARKKSAVLRIETAYDARLRALKTEQKTAFKAAALYAEGHREELFQKRKSAENDFATYGFELPPASVKTAKGINEAAALRLVENDVLFADDGFVDYSPKLDKSKIAEALKRLETLREKRAKGALDEAETADALKFESLAEIFRLEQDEVFFIREKSAEKAEKGSQNV